MPIQLYHRINGISLTATFILQIIGDRQMTMEEVVIGVVEIGRKVVEVCLQSVLKFVVDVVMNLPFVTYQYLIQLQIFQKRVKFLILPGVCYLTSQSL